VRQELEAAFTEKNWVLILDKSGNPHEIHPQAGEELARPLREPVQERLDRLLRYFEHQGKSPYVRVMATARDEREPDKLGEISSWDKLQWEKYPCNGIVMRHFTQTRTTSLL
jgi:hypothetical protein